LHQLDERDIAQEAFGTDEVEALRTSFEGQDGRADKQEFTEFVRPRNGCRVR
jgi:hypothetical protein